MGNRTSPMDRLRYSHCKDFAAAIDIDTRAARPSSDSHELHNFPKRPAGYGVDRRIYRPGYRGDCAFESVC